MITEKDLREAIAECQGVRNPNANTCIKLAAFLILMDKLYPDTAKSDVPMYSYAAPPTDEPVKEVVRLSSDTEFSSVVDGRPQYEVMPVLDELMSTLQVTNPRLYAGVMRKLEN